MTGRSRLLLFQLSVFAATATFVLTSNLQGVGTEQLEFSDLQDSPTESQCRPYIEKALKERGTGESSSGAEDADSPGTAAQQDEQIPDESDHEESEATQEEESTEAAESEERDNVETTSAEQTGGEITSAEDEIARLTATSTESQDTPETGGSVGSEEIFEAKASTESQEIQDDRSSREKREVDSESTEADETAEERPVSAEAAVASTEEEAAAGTEEVAVSLEEAESAETDVPSVEEGAYVTEGALNVEETATTIEEVAASAEEDASSAEEAAINAKEEVPSVKERSAEVADEMSAEEGVARIEEAAVVNGDEVSASTEEGAATSAGEGGASTEEAVGTSADIDDDSTEEEAASAEKVAVSTEEGTSAEAAASNTEEGAASREVVAASIDEGTASIEELIGSIEEGAASAEEADTSTEGAASAEEAVPSIEEGTGSVEEAAPSIKEEAASAEEAAISDENGTESAEEVADDEPISDANAEQGRVSTEEEPASAEEGVASDEEGSSSAGEKAVKSEETTASGDEEATSTEEVPVASSKEINEGYIISAGGGTTSDGKGAHSTEKGTAATAEQSTSNREEDTAANAEEDGRGGGGEAPSAEDTTTISKEGETAANEAEESSSIETRAGAEKLSASGEEVSAEVSTEGETTLAPEAETTPEEELTLGLIIPDNLRPRDHIAHILKLDSESAERELLLTKTVEVTLKELKKIYDNAIKPLEVLYKYRDLSNRHFGDPEIFSKPLILFMGPWSGGKSSIINYLLDIEYKQIALRTGAEPSPAYFNILMWGDREEVIDGTQLAADWTFSGLQKFGQGLLDRLRGLRLTNKLLEKVNIVEIPGILEIRKQVERLFPFNDACQWFIDRADVIFLVYDPAKLDVGPETEAILDQLKGREYQTRIILNKADQVRPEELMRVQGTLIWNISPLMSSSEPPVMYSTSLWSLPYESGAPIRLLQAQERAFLRDMRTAIDKRVENKIASARRFAVRVRNHAKMVDCYLTTYYNHKGFFGNRKKVSDDIIERPQDYHIYEGLSTLTNISRYDLPDPDVYRDFFRLNPLYDFQQLSATCTYFRGCPINRLDVAIAYDLPELVGKYKKSVDETLASQQPSKS